jgi:kynurenine formamidase
MGTLVDLSHAIENGMPVYPALPAPKIGAYLDHAGSRDRYQGKAEFYLSSVEMSGNTGTYLDSPFHRYPDRADLSRLPLEALAGLPGLVADAPAQPGPVDLALPAGAFRGCAVLVRTGWDRRWRTADYWQPGPFLSPAALDLLIAGGAALVGVDYWNIDDTADLARPAHTRLLAAGILIVENLANLAALPGAGFRFYAVPPRIVSGASFPVRAFAEITGATG